MKKIIITGNVGRDPELRSDQNGNQFATFSVGVSVGTKQMPKTDWIDVSCNGKLADIARNYVRKGTKVLIEGFPSAGAYINKDNKPVGVLRIYANNLELLSKREDSSEHDSFAGHDDNIYTLPESNNQASGSKPLLDAEDLNSIPF